MQAPTAPAIGVIADIVLALVAGVVIANEPATEVPERMLQAPEGSCVTGVDMSYYHGQKHFDVAAETPQAVVSEINGVAASASALDVMNLVDETKIVYVEENGVRSTAVRVENFGSAAEPQWVPISIESITECGVEGEPPSAKELLL